MKPKTLSVLFAITSSIISINPDAFGQHPQNSLGLFAEVGESRPKLMGTDNIDPTFKITTHYAPSATAGIYYSCLLKDKFILGTKLLVTTLGSKGDFYWQWDATTPPQSWQEGTIEGRVLGLGVEPFSFGYKYKKVSLNFGMRAVAFVWYTYQDTYTHSYYGGMNGTTLTQTSYEEDDKGNSTDFIYDLGATATISYHINKRVTAEGNYYYDLYNNTDPAFGVVVKLRQFTFGIKYAIFVSGKGTEDQKKKETKKTEQ